MRWSFLVLLFALAAVPSVAKASHVSSHRSYSSRSMRPPPCTMPALDCAMVPAISIVGGASTLYVGAWIVRRGELPVALHAGGLVVGGLSVVSGIGYAAGSKLSSTRSQVLSTAAIVVGLPSLVLGLHGLLSHDVASDEAKPAPTPVWYGSGYLSLHHPAPTMLVDTHGALVPALTASGTFL